MLYHFFFYLSLKKYTKLRGNALINVLALLVLGCGTQTPHSSEPVFSLLSKTETGIHFNNKIEEGLNTNVLMYEYFYNGGGVAAGDLNNDGKEDLYFTSNMEDNHLYLNEGNLRFKEVATEAGVKGRPGPWKTGVSMVDINADGMLDIYLCYSGNLPAEKKRNQLFINKGNNANGIPVFADEAATYGLDHPGNSTHAVFFDHDRDQDLDMILVNHNPKSLPVLDESSTADLLQQEDENSGIVFFENPGNGAAFIKRTREMGIRTTGLSYGLAVGVSDLNKDGWLDFYVSNDYTIPDYLYINNKGKGFTNVIDKAIGHFSHFSMGNDIADINNDLLPDIFTLDMLPEDNKRQKLLMAPDNYEKFDFNLRVGFGYQYMRNMLQLNQGVEPSTGLPVFAEVGQIQGISNTDWSWSALFADYDNDGWKDLYVTNGYLRDYTNLDFLKYMGDYVQNNQQHIQRENILELVKKMPSSNLTNYVFKNAAKGNFDNRTEQWGVKEISNSNGAVYADLDNDGDLEIIVNNINKAAFVFENKTVQSPSKKHYLTVALKGEGQNSHGLGARVSVYANGSKQLQEQNPFRSYQSSVSYKLHFGLDTLAALDSVVVVWNSGKKQVLKDPGVDGILELEEAQAINASIEATAEKPYLKLINAALMPIDDPQYNDFKIQTQLILPQSFLHPKMEKGDFNGDGWEDLFVGATGSTPATVLFQSKSNNWSSVHASTLGGTEGKITGVVVLEDFDQDGDLDIYHGLGGYANLLDSAKNQPVDQFFWNDGKGRFVTNTALNVKLPYAGRAAATKIDLDGNPLPDLFIAPSVIPGQFPMVHPPLILKNLGKGQFVPVANAFKDDAISGLITDLKWYDLNKDGNGELIVAGHWMPLGIYALANGKFQNVSDQYFDEHPYGMWNHILIDDLNGDGKPEILLGNLGRNSQLRASPKQPLELLVKDFDQNGSIDPILTYYVKGVRYPFMTRDELLDQMTMMRNRFTSYESYAEAKLEDLFSKKEMEGARQFKIDELNTVLFTQEPSGKFKTVGLPVEVQYSPLFAAAAFDVDGDGSKEILLGGNIRNARLRLGNMDAGYGNMIKFDKALTARFINTASTGMWIKGDIRNLIAIGENIFAGVRGQAVKHFKINQ